MVPKARIASMIDGFKDRLGSIYEFDFKEESTDRLIDKCKEDIESLYILLERLYGTLIRQTKKRLEDLRLYPLPMKFYP